MVTFVNLGFAHLWDKSLTDGETLLKMSNEEKIENMRGKHLEFSFVPLF